MRLRNEPRGKNIISNCLLEAIRNEVDVDERVVGS